MISRTVAIVDYGMGNLRSVQNAVEHLGGKSVIVANPLELSTYDKIILPGVGAFDWAMTRLNESGMRDCLDELVVNNKCPVLGICVGMQMMAGKSDEGKLDGLGWIDAEVRKFDEKNFTQQTHLPHMGWNDVIPNNTDSIKPVTSTPSLKGSVV